MDNDELVITHLPLPSVANRRALRGRPLPTDDSLHVSGLRYDSKYGWHVRVSTGNARAYFMAEMALAKVPHTWMAWKCTIQRGVVVLTGPDYRASAEQAREFFETFVYDQADDPEYRDCAVLLNDRNSFWYGRE